MGIEALDNTTGNGIVLQNVIDSKVMNNKVLTFNQPCVTG